MDEKYIRLLESEEIQGITDESVIDLRENYTYGAIITVNDDGKINDLKKSCQDLVEITKQIIYG